MVIFYGPSSMKGSVEIQSNQWFAGRQQEVLISNCTLPHFYLRDYIAQTITANYILQNFVGGIAPFLGPSVYFRGAGLTNHHFRRCICCRRNTAKAAVQHAIPLELDFTAASHTLLEITDRFKTIIFKTVCADSCCHVGVPPVQKVLGSLFLAEVKA